MRIRTVKISKLNTESFDKLLVDIVNDNFGYVLQCVENVADSKGCTRIDLKIVFDIPHDSITYDYVHHLFNEYKRIGMDSWWRFSYRKIFDEKFAIHSYPITEKIVENKKLQESHAKTASLLERALKFVKEVKKSPAGQIFFGRKLKALDIDTKKLSAGN